VTILPYRDSGLVRFASERRGETLSEITMVDGALIVWRCHFRPSDLTALLADDGASVSITSTRRDRIGPIVILGERLSIVADLRVECGRLPPDHNPSGSRDRS
jgi:hypothetical protein